ncbi:protein DOUBLE-STRAND BREAK FORMATION [Tasmannia lanceolata]|uniref:protein DOUBLE-STRAND BREAK FORMATION n=1 Tax=Tasmannia lanceolata TaxID=3420 RepID=UPI0040634AA0
MSEGIGEPISFFRSQLQNRRFDEQTLRILESVLVSKDVKSLLEIRSSLKHLMRSEAVTVLKEITEKSVDHKLSVVNFFVNAFALVGDVESCLTLKYEAFALRDLKYANHHEMQVSYVEWLTFADDSLDNGFYSIAVKGYENALLHIQPTDIVNSKPDIFFSEAQVVVKIQELRDIARTLVASQSVQAQTAVYLKKKATQENNKRGSYSMYTQNSASLMFRSGIKKRNIQKLHESQRLNKNIAGS